MKHETGNTKYEMMVNKSLPYIMHIDLNSCFAIIEQQANRLLRGRPVGVAAYDTPRGFVVAASYEAKAKGIKLGVNVEQARALAPGIVIMTPDPAKYREAHRLFKEVLLEYSPDVTPKSIDEFVLNLENSPILHKKLLKHKTLVSKDRPWKLEKCGEISEISTHNAVMLEIGRDIKKRIAERLGEWVTVNIGIATNRFLAKYAAGFDKPDGMTLIDHTNLHSKYENMHLVDLPGINTRYRIRLRAQKIYTPLDFLAADMNTLKKQVFKSINGYYWYLRLRGYEVDDVAFSRKIIGHQHALSDKTTNLAKLKCLLMKLCEKTGRRLRKNDLYATGVHLYIGFIGDNSEADRPASFEHMYKFKSWHHGEKVGHRLYSTEDIYNAAKKLLHSAEISNRVKTISVHVYGLENWDPVQLNLFEIEKSKVEGRRSKVDPTAGGQKSKIKTIATDLRSQDARKRVSDAVDGINNRYGEFVITPALMMEMQGTILDRIAFGQVKDI